MTISTLTPEQVRWFRLRRSGLVEPFDSPAIAASALVGIQAQILPAAALSLWNRTKGLTHTAFNDLLYEKRSLVKLWGQRGTLHLYPSHEWPLMVAAFSYQPTWWERRAKDMGLTVADYRAKVVSVVELLRQKQTLGRSDLRAANVDLHEDFFSSWGGIFRDLAHHGYACHARQEGNEGRFAHREHWLPDLEWNPPSPAEANVALFRRYLHAYGPATLQDFTYWRYAPAGHTRQWLAALQDEITEVSVARAKMLALRCDIEALHEIPPAPEEWPVRLLYRFEPLLLGHKDKSWLIDMAYYKRVWRPAGHIEGVIVDYGRIAGAWRYDRKGSGLVVTVYPFAALREAMKATITEHATGVARFFGLPLNELVIVSDTV